MEAERLAEASIHALRVDPPGFNPFLLPDRRAESDLSEHFGTRAQ